MHKSAWILLAALALGAAFMLWFSGARQEPAAIPSMLPPQSPEAPELESPAATSARVESAPVAAAAQSEEHVPSIHGSNEVDAFELALSKRDLSQEDWGTTTLDFEKAEAYAHEVAGRLRAEALRVEADVSAEKLGAKIRKAQIDKIPYMVVVGEKDMAARVVSPRTREGQQQPAVGLDEFAQRLAKEAAPPDVGPAGPGGV